MKRTLALALATAAFAGAQAAILWDNGGYHDYMNSTFNTPPGSYANIGFSSGNLSTASPNRWFAQPFSLKSSATITQVNASWFTPAGSEGLTVTLRVWKRTGTSKPVAADEVATVSAGPYVVNIQDPRAPFATTNWNEHLLPVPLSLPAGDYWMSIYSDDKADPLQASVQLAWFGGSPGALRSLEGPADGTAGWRAAAYPSPGFAAYNPASLGPNRHEMAKQDCFNLDYQLVGTSSNQVCHKITGRVKLPEVGAPGFDENNDPLGFIFYCRFELRDLNDNIVADRAAWVSWQGADDGNVGGTYEILAPSTVNGPFKISCKPDLYLRKAFSGTIDPTSADVANVDFSCIGGDADGDNTVTVFDYGILSTYFDKTSADADFSDPFNDGMESPFMADFDSDGAITVFDYGILSSNFDLAGDAGDDPKS